MRLVEMVLEALGHPTDRFTFGVLADDNNYLRSTAIVRLAKLRRSAITETK
jgi:glutamine cyclotransferase